MIIFKFLKLYSNETESLTIISKLYSDKYGYNTIYPSQHDLEFIYDKQKILQIYLPSLNLTFL